jgi:hypothetical protein
MGLVKLPLFLLSLTLYYQVSSLEQLAYYKFWESVSDQLIYDYSRKLRHAGLFGNYVYTDRGLSMKHHSYLNLMSYGFIDIREYVFSFWMLNNDYEGQYSFSISYNDKKLLFHHDFMTDFVKLEIQDNLIYILLKQLDIDISYGWNLHTFRFYID